MGIAKPTAREASLLASVDRGPLGIVFRDALNGRGVVTTIAGLGRVGQVTTAGQPDDRIIAQRNQGFAAL